MHKPTLSKSQYIKGLNCLKSLWIYKNDKDAIPPVSASVQALFDMGHALTEVSMQYYNNGVEVTNEYWDITGREKRTQQYIADGKDIIYEATAINPTNGAYSRIDILRKVPDTDMWDMIELKGSTQVKDYHYDDLSFQYHVFTGAGYKINQCFMMLVDNTYVRQGNIDPQKLFRLHDITIKVLEMQDGIDDRIQNLITMTQQDQIPDDCSDPYNCDVCGADIPEYSVYNIFRKPHMQSIVQEYGTEIENLPLDIKVSGIKALDLQSYLGGDKIADKYNLTQFVNDIEYPIYYLDYETIMTAIPMFDGTRPFQQIPFQFSVHIQHTPNGELEHYEYLHKDTSDPRENFVKELVRLCGTTGSVVVYNQVFEATRNKELAIAFPQYANEINAITNRFIDLLIPFKNRWLYHPNQHSSASIKAVLPCFTDLSYDGLEITNGGDAMNIYAQFIMGKIPQNAQPQMWYNLSKYCKLDTYAMKVLLDAIYDEIR